MPDSLNSRPPRYTDHRALNCDSVGPLLSLLAGMLERAGVCSFRADWLEVDLGF